MRAPTLGPPGRAGGVPRSALATLCTRLAALCGGLACLAAAVSPATALAPASAPEPARREPVDGTDVSSRVMAEVNRERAARGLAPLAWPAALQRAADQRARDIAALPAARRMNRTPRIDAFLAANGITRYAFARERLLLLGGDDDPVTRILGMWKDYAEGWQAAMAPAVAEAGMGWAHAGDGWSVFLAILIEPVAAPDDKTLAEIERAVHERVNRERAAYGASRLRWNDDLAAVAHAHSRDMAARGFFAHEDPDGLSPADRTLAAGLRYLIVAENIATSRNQDDPAAAAVEGWMDSPGHRVNLLNPRVTLTGVGAAVDDGGNVYVTQLYLAPAPGGSSRAPDGR